MDELKLPTTVEDGLRSLRGKIAVTGASGWVGRAVLELFELALGRSFTDRVLAFASSPKSIVLRSGTTLRARSLTDLPSLATDGMVVVHLAFLTREQASVLGLDRYVAANLAITATVVDALARCRCAGLVYTSSGAVYGEGGRLETDLDQDPYGTLKHIDELTLAAACERSGTRLAVSRIFALSGPYMTKPRQFALGDLLLQALDGGPIEVRAAHRVFRSYAAPTDVLSVAMAHLLDHDSAPALTFDAAGPAVEVGDLATRIATAFGVPLAARPASSGPDDRYVGDPEPYATLLGALGRTPRSLDEQIADTADWLRSLSRPRPSTADAASPTDR